MASSVLPFPIPSTNDIDGDDLPPCPDVALFLGALFLRLGGNFTIGSNGVRYMGRPEPAFFRLQDKPLPEVPNAQPHEKFHNAGEWRGALKLVDAMISRLCKQDRDFIFDALATAAARGDAIAAIDEPTRREA